ncbi:helix-turn-helix domain-containing protein [Streptomyces sp. NPDC014733]|uniref:helix-turn-helix domain-containing protein n=1 Tax=Streptomyces sp. NPDC014733 TaxID=3364885 RepID=UPI0036F9453E
MTCTDSFRSGPEPTLIREARARFLAGCPLPDGVPEPLVSAWRRAVFFGVPHDLGAAAAPRAPGDGPLAAAARPVLERLAGALDDGERRVLVADARCRVVCRGGPPSPGTLRDDLSEEVVGHNSAALALRYGQRSETHGPEHFLDLWQEVSAVSVPVRRPGAARALGTVTLVRGLCDGGGGHPDTALAEAVAAAVEAEWAARGPREPERRLLDAFARERAAGRAVLAFDGRSRLVSEAAAALLSPEAVDGLERQAVALLGADGPAGRWDGEPVVRWGGAVAARLRAVRDSGAVTGALAVVEEEAGGAGREPGADAVPCVPPGSSAVWRHTVERAVDLFSCPRPLLLTGERGTGKSTLGRALLRGPDGAAQPLTVDAACAPDGELAALRPYPAADGGEGPAPLLLRHVERLGQRDVAALVALLDERPRLPLVVTHTPGTEAGPCLARLLDTLGARSVTLPPLRERPEDLPALLTRLAPPPSPGHPPLTWTLEAVRALEAHPWPGNVTELAALVREVARGRRSAGPVRREELPRSVRRRAAPPPGTVERAERETILAALRTHGGNKARAAASLGIARATLYRKLRGYG